MSQLYGRSWRVTIGSLQSSDIDIDATITKRLSGHPASCKLQVFNLTTDHRNEIRDAGVGDPVRIEAGYGDQMPIVFQGATAQRADIKRTTSDWIVEVTCGDGLYALRTSRVNRSFAAGTSLSSVVSYCCDQLGLGVGNTLDALGSSPLDQATNTYQTGIAVHGFAYRRLTEMLRSAGFTWSVQNGVLQVLARGAALQRAAIVIDKDHGMLDSPERGKGGIVRVRSLLQPDFVPGQPVHVDSAVVSGDYRIEKVVTHIDSRGKDWTATMDLRSTS